MLHHVRKPFYSRQGQFSDGQDLCAGISLDSLQASPIHVLRVGKIKITEYTFDSADVLTKSQGRFFIKNDKKIVIVPLNLWCVKKEEIADNERS